MSFFVFSVDMSVSTKLTYYFCDRHAFFLFMSFNTQSLNLLLLGLSLVSTTSEGNTLFLYLLIQV